MAKAKGGLGRGLGALLPEYDELLNDGSEKVQELELDQIIPNAEQPRKIFDEDGLRDLTESIRENGVLQPILVTPRDGKYQIIAGERRWRASKKAGLSTIPAIVRDVADEKLLEQALIENVQRTDLTPIEEARAYRTLQERYGYTQEVLSKRVGKSRSAISNSMRLLSLPEDVQEMVEEGKLTVGHVRPLLSVNEPSWQSSFAHEVYQANLSVREVEKAVKNFLKRSEVMESPVLESKSEDAQEQQKLSDALRILQDQLAQRLSTKVTIKAGRGKGGKLILEYYSQEDLKRIIDAMGGQFY